MLPDWISTWWQAACLPELWDVCGVSVPSLSLWHTFALENIGNRYLCPGKPPTKDDATSLLIFAKQDRAGGLRLLHSADYRALWTRRIVWAIRKAEQHTIASLLAGSRLEFLRADGFFIAGEESGEFGAGFEGYGWRQEIVETDLRGLYEVRVAVLAANSMTPTPLYELTTLLFKKPLESLYEETEGDMARERERSWERLRRQVKR